MGIGRLRLVLGVMRLVLHRPHLAFLDLAEHGFDVNHRCAVNRFDRTDSETILQDPAHRDLMKADRIGPVWRPGGENPHQYSARI